MKKILSIIIALSCALAFTACESDEVNDSDNFAVVESNTLIPAIGGNGYVRVNTSGSYTAASDQNWCQVSVVGDSVVVTATANTSNRERSAMISLLQGNTKLDVPCIQYGAVISFATVDTIKATYRAQTLTGSYVQSNLSVSASTDAAWVTAAIDADKNVVLTFTENTGDPRYCNLTLTAGSTSKTVVIAQAAAFAVDKTSLSFGFTGAPAQTATVTYTTMPTVTVADTWCHATLSGTTLTVKCDTAPTARTTTITVASGALTKTIAVSQSGAPSYADYIGTWELSGTDFTTGDAGSYTITIAQKVAGVSYEVVGWSSNPNLSSQPIEALFQNYSIEFHGSQQVGTFSTTHEIHFVGFIPYNDSYSLITGNYTAMDGILNGNKVTFNMHDVTLSSGDTYTFFAMGLRLKDISTSGWTYFTSDPLVLTNPVMTKQ